MRSLLPRLALLPFLALLLAAPPRADATELGRLFFTPEQRAALDARRKARVPDKPEAPSVAAPTIRLDGYVKRSGGRSTVWVNGETADPAARLPDGGAARVAVRAGEGGGVVRLKPGETLDRGNGEVSDLIGEGEIRVRRP